MATKKLLGDLAGLSEKRTGRPIAVESIGGVDAARRVRDGGVVDLVVLASGFMETLEAERLLVPGSRQAIAVSTTAFAVRSGTVPPDLSSPAALRHALLEARSIGYSTGPSGDHLANLVERWGLGPLLAGRLVKAPPGVPVGSFVASGQAAIGFQQYSELFEVPGISVITDFAEEARATTVFTAAIATACTDPAAAEAALAVMTSPEAAELCRHCGLTPPGE
jgi:molybdate transport system substrate-binding protein